MASYKQELTQLHQLLAQTRFHAKNELGLNTEIEHLENYKEVGITSLHLDADIEKHKDAILALASDLATTFERQSLPARPSETTEIPSHGPTERATLVDVTADGSMQTVETPASPAAAQPAPSEPEQTAAETSAKVIPGADVENVNAPVLHETSLLDNWSAVRERLAEDEEQSVDAVDDEPVETEQVQLAVDVQSQQDALITANDSNAQPVEAEAEQAQELL